MNILIYAQYNFEKNKLCDASQHTLNAAISLQPHLKQVAAIDIILFCKEPLQINKNDYKAIRKIYYVCGKDCEQQLAHIVAPILIKLSDNYDYILTADNFFGRANLPIVAANLNVNQISDIIDIVDYNIFKRSIYTGNAIATIKTNSAKILLTIRSSAFTNTIEPLNNYETIVEKLDIVENSHIKKVTFIKEQQNKQNDVDLQSAKIVISGGRGLKSQEDFIKILSPLAQKLNAAIGATRAAVDAGFAPNDWQIGQTGKIVAPALYIAIGLSGAQQHITGMKDSKTIIAINNNVKEPIVTIADYALIGDLFELVPKLNQKLN